MLFTLLCIIIRKLHNSCLKYDEQSYTHTQCNEVIKLIIHFYLAQDGSFEELSPQVQWRIIVTPSFPRINSWNIILAFLLALLFTCEKQCFTLFTLLSRASDELFPKLERLKPVEYRLYLVESAGVRVVSGFTASLL